MIIKWIFLYLYTARLYTAKVGCIMDLEAIQKAVSGAITAAISRAVGTPLLTDAASTSGQQSSTATSTGNDEQTVERKYACVSV